MSNTRLLKRIKQWEQKTNESIDSIDSDLLIDTILQDLSDLFNTRKGSVLMDANYGIEDFTSLMSTMAPPEIEQLCQSFNYACNHYEQRLQQTVVEYEFRESDMGMIRFVCLAKLNFSEQSKTVKFYILLQGNGSVGIEIAN